MNDLLFSIIIPTRNSEDTIEKCLESVLAQVDVNFEILVIDGLSTDLTVSRVQNFEYPRITILSEKDLGVYDAMNKGIRLAQGNWLYFLGSDDEIYDPKVLSDISHELAEKELDLIYGNVRFPGTEVIHAGRFDLHRLLYDRNICHQSIFYSKRIFDRVGGYNLGYNVIADWDLNIRCFKHPELRIIYLDRIIAWFNPNGISAVIDWENENLLQEIPLYKVKQIEMLRRSWDYRIGHILVQPFRWIKHYLFSKHHSQKGIRD